MPCPVCKATLQAFWLKYGRKFSFFDKHCQFLPVDHEFRNDIVGFWKNVAIHNGPLERMTGEEVQA
jgi:hypothetical protein